MSVDWTREAPRLAKLARLDLDDAETASLAAACEAITREFSALTRYASTLPEPSPAAAGPVREDEVAPSGEADAILAAAPKVDHATREVLVPRGGP